MTESRLQKIDGVSLKLHALEGVLENVRNWEHAQGLEQLSEYLNHSLTPTQLHLCVAAVVRVLEGEQERLYAELAEFLGGEK